MPPLEQRRKTARFVAWISLAIALLTILVTPALRNALETHGTGAVLLAQSILFGLGTLTGAVAMGQTRIVGREKIANTAPAGPTVNISFLVLIWVTPLALRLLERV